MNSVSQIAIVGVGQVGGAAAYSIILTSFVSELLLVDIDVDLRDGQVRDLSDVAYSCNSSTRVRAASHHEAAKADIVVITAGSKHMIGQTTIDQISRNMSIVREVVETMKPFRLDTVLLVVSNPIDLLTSLAHELSGLPTSQVLGSGTFLDSVRLRGLVAMRAGIAANSIDIYVVGVHGNPQVVAWSAATVGGVPINKAIPPNILDRDKLADECKHWSQSIIRAKGSTPFGLGSIVSSLCASIFLDKRNVCPVSHFQPDFGCYFSLPAVLGKKGVMSTIHMPLDSDEEAHVAKSANELSETIDWIHRSY